MSELIKKFTGALITVALLNGCSVDPEYDLLLQGGTIIDGTGAAAYVADVGLIEDQIVAISADIPEGQARQILDVSGLTVAPGFWDNHAHLDTLEQYPNAENFIRQGITTILAPLHSQDQPFPLDEYMSRVKMAPNVGLFAGHNWIRKQVMGLENRAPTPDELEQMQTLVDESMQQGALGLSTGLEYVPAVYSSTDEVVALATVAAQYGGIYVTHMRDEGIRVLESIQETLEVGQRANIPVQVNHHKVTGAAQWGSTEQTLSMLDAAVAAGQEVAHDLYPYAAFSTYSDLLFPAWSLADGQQAFEDRITNQATRAQIVDEMHDIFVQQTGPGPDSVQFRELNTYPEMQGQTLADFLIAQGRPTTLDEAIEALIDLQVAGGFIGIFHGMDEADLIRLMRHPTAMFETDGDLVQPGFGYPHPRSYGSFPRILAKYVREDGVLTLEAAVRKMSALPAQWTGQEELGTLKATHQANIVVFNAETIQDRS